MPNTGRRKGQPAAYEAAYCILTNGLARQDSAFTPGKPVWTPENFATLRRHFVEQPNLSKDSYLHKLRGQLLGADPAAIQLMAEVHYLHLLAPDTVTAAKKRQIVEEVLGFMGRTVSIPEELLPALDCGFLNPGTYFSTRRDRQVSFLVEFGEAGSALPAEQRKALLKDPWEFKRFVYALPVNSAFTQREALLHLAYPDTFEAIVSHTHKEQIAKRFASLVSAPTDDVDRRLDQIRIGLTAEYGDAFDFYSEPLRSRWQTKPGSAWEEFVKWASKFHQSPNFEAEERDYKLTVFEALSTAHDALLRGDDWTTLLVAAFRHPNNNMTDWRVHDRFLKWTVAEAGADAALSALWTDAEVATRIDAFLDHVPASEVGAVGAKLNLTAFLLGAQSPLETPIFKSSAFKRARDLTQTAAPPAGSSPSAVYLAFLDFLDAFIDEAAARGLALRDRLDAQSLMWCVVRWEPEPSWSPRERVAFATWRGDPPPMDESDNLSVVASEVFFDAPALERVVTLLGDKGQVIFHGPPGTGKTFVARKLAEHLAGTDGSVELVQFHPSYSYEDFVQGFRPAADGTGFTLRDGPLLRAAARADESPHGTHILIIDEINRGNLAKVLGELYFLLEYRKEEIALQYSDIPFRLPKNLWVIGTMNTSDRYIAIVDGALRRRFYFVPFFPSEAPVDRVLRRWLEDKPHLGWVGDVVDRANELLADRQAAVGPSHFMRPGLDEEWVELIWEHSVLPYIAEQLFGQEDRLPEFSLAALRTYRSGQASDEPLAAASD